MAEAMDKVGTDAANVQLTTPELKKLFERRGGKIEDHRLIFNSVLRAPSSTSPVAR